MRELSCPFIIETGLLSESDKTSYKKIVNIQQSVLILDYILNSYINNMDTDISLDTIFKCIRRGSEIALSSMRTLATIRQIQDNQFTKTLRLLQSTMMFNCSFKNDEYTDLVPILKGNEFGKCLLCTDDICNQNMVKSRRCDHKICFHCVSEWGMENIICPCYGHPMEDFVPLAINYEQHEVLNQYDQGSLQMLLKCRRLLSENSQLFLDISCWSTKMKELPNVAFLDFLNKSKLRYSRLGAEERNDAEERNGAEFAFAECFTFISKRTFSCSKKFLRHNTINQYII